MALKLISLNVEGDNHYERIFPFLRSCNPDVVCLQEFFLEDLPLFEQQLSMHGYAVGMWMCSRENDARIASRGLMGAAIFSKLPLQDPRHFWYTGSADQVLDLFASEVGPEKVSRALLVGDIVDKNQTYRIATTHFTWSPGGSVTPIQEQHLQKLLPILSKIEPFVLCGDFNAPRGKAIFQALSDRYTDNIPPEITTTMDQHLHRMPGLQFVVDVLFTDSSYVASDVQVVDGVSDHCAIVATIDVQ